LAIDRAATLKNAEKYLRGGRLEAAITEYARVVEDQPRDWTTANTLGDLYLRVGQSDRAVALYHRVGEQLLTQGFYPRAAALYKKLLKLTPEDEGAQLRLAELSVRLGLLAEAKALYLAVVNRRRQRGDAPGADEMAIRLGVIDPADLQAQLEAARALERTGDLPAAARQYRKLHEELIDRKRHEEAAAALQDCLRCDPPARDSSGLREQLAIELDAGRLDAARELLREVLAVGGGSADAVVALAWTLADTHVDGAVLCVEAAADASVAAGELRVAAAILQEFAMRVPGQIGTLLKLVEIAVDGGFEAPMYEAQAQLADAYLAAQRPDDARVIAEDLVTHDPRDPSHIERLRQALQMLQVEDVEAAIAARVNEAAADPPALVPAPVMEAPPAATPASAAPPERAAPKMDEIDLTSLLGEMEDDAGDPSPRPGGPRSTRDLDVVFAGIRANASREEEAENSGEHLALGRTYVLMGMPDQAIGPLEIASRAPQHRFAAASSLAQIYRDQSDLRRAIEWFERAAEAPATDPEDGYALLYDLADVLDTVGEHVRALAVFLELAVDAPDFRDVRDRVTHLSNAETEG
jgi:tetratricopeptide (TPR) repeat protein